jgi:hypothetical protein
VSEDWETRLIGQQGENPPPGFHPLVDRLEETPPPKRVIPSPATAQIIEDIRTRTFGEME